MSIRLNRVAPLLALGAAAVAIAAAPIAAAAPAPVPTAAVQQSCSSTGSASLCQSPGNAQLNASTPPVSFDPYGGEEFLMGGYGGSHGARGGIHGGGGGGHR
jgi:hypothetical protein